MAKIPLGKVKGDPGAGVHNLGAFGTEELIKQQPKEEGNFGFVGPAMWMVKDGEWSEVGDLQGPRGEKGEDGDTVAIAGVTVQVDSTTGEPKGSATVTGDKEKTINFNFSGLKGEPGEAAKVTYPITVEHGGTGATTVATARDALGLGNTDGALPIANGGTGATTAANARNALGLGNTTEALEITHGGTGATDVEGAKKNLGLDEFEKTITDRIDKEVSPYTDRLDGIELVLLRASKGTGENLGTSISEEQIQAIRDGNFLANNMLVGNYWTISGTKWYVADYNYFKKYWRDTSGNSKAVTPITQSHIILIPEKALGTQAWNSSNTADSGYGESELRKAIDGGSKYSSLIPVALQSYVLPHWEYFANACSSGVPTSGKWYENCKCNVMSASQYGLTSNTQNQAYYNEPAFLLFQSFPDYRKATNYDWLRDTYNANFPCLVNSNGNVNYDNATTAFGVRPYLVIG